MLIPAYNADRQCTWNNKRRARSVGKWGESKSRARASIITSSAAQIACGNKTFANMNVSLSQQRRVSILRMHSSSRRCKEVSALGHKTLQRWQLTLHARESRKIILTAFHANVFVLQSVGRTWVKLPYRPRFMSKTPAALLAARDGKRFFSSLVWRMRSAWQRVHLLLGLIGCVASLGKVCRR